ncbi:MAG: CopD family protein [Deltaproteobacteria bacterium]|nr:CopD family protein [Deltaproteobacteria bacterium]
MKEVMLALSYWLHLTATVVWIGGTFFILFIAIPSTKQVLGADASKLMGKISKRFTPIANYSIIALIVTGITLTALNKQFSGIGNFGNNWTLVLILKHFLVLGMVVVHFYRGLVLTPKIARTESATKKTSLQKLSLNLVKLNFCIGLIVLLISGIISII